jgi:pantoate--beta-alanine ligase
MQIIRDISSLESIGGGTIVPTMGALHEGHLDLIRLACTMPEPVVVTVFVNPRQFSPGEDYESYPRSLEDDCKAASDAGADAVFAPPREVIYPDDQTCWSPPLPDVAITPCLEDRFRPHFFEGVCLVVARLFDLTHPCRAVFGEKDFQQLRVVESLTEQHQERWPGLEIIPGPTRRECDGLAMSSRNAYLDPSSRHRALALYRALRAASSSSHGDAEQLMETELHAADLKVDYAVVRDASSLAEIDDTTTTRRALIAARLGDVRLIDNMEIP